MNLKDNVHIVYLYRRDMQAPLELFATQDPKEALKKLNEVEKAWEEAQESSKLMRLRDPIIRSFPPGLCIEVIIDQMTLSDYQNMKNQFTQEMNKLGTTEFMNQHFSQK